ncbi:MAG: hypothetical protein MUF54_13195 [Polyangiaceae bacterium]|nr:hypothetical protein [Polyangiaceae bacterium]
MAARDSPFIVERLVRELGRERHLLNDVDDEALRLAPCRQRDLSESAKGKLGVRSERQGVQSDKTKLPTAPHRFEQTGGAFPRGQGCEIDGVDLSCPIPQWVGAQARILGSVCVDGRRLDDGVRE